MAVKTTCDVAVVGAGPAGAWAAYLLARGGARVRLFDASHPREKPCGGGVTGRALALVAGAIDVSELPRVVIERATFRDASGRAVDVPLHPVNTPAALIVASRAEFDARLLAAAVGAGAEHLASRVVDVAREGRGFLLTTAAGAFSAGTVIGADGANSFVRRRLAQPFTRKQLSIATGFFACGATSTAIVLEMVDEPPGYIWSFPRCDHLAVGICAQADSGATPAALRARAERWIADARLAPSARLVPYSWPIPSLSAADFDSLEPCGTGWMLVGDAAGLVDPITREGIFFALESAQLAAGALLAGGASARTYTDRLHGAILDELARAARLKEGFFRPRFTRLLLDALDESEAIRRVMGGLVSGAQGYRGLKWRLAQTLEVGLALRALAG